MGHGRIYDLYGLRVEDSKCTKPCKHTNVSRYFLQICTFYAPFSSTYSSLWRQLLVVSTETEARGTNPRQLCEWAPRILDIHFLWPPFCCFSISVNSFRKMWKPTKNKCGNLKEAHAPVPHRYSHHWGYHAHRYGRNTVSRDVVGRMSGAADVLLATSASQAHENGWAPNRHVLDPGLFSSKSL